MQGNVLQVASWAGTYPGNFMACLEALGRELALAGFDQGYLFPLAARDRAWIPDLASRTFVDFLPEDFRGQVTAIRNCIRKTGAKIVHTSFTRYDVAAWGASLGTGASVLWHMHSERAVPRTLPWLLKDIIKYRTIGRAVHSVTVSHRVRDWIISRGMPEHRTSIVENAVDITRASSPSASRDRLRADLKIRPETICLVLFGWEPDRKGVDIALRGLEPLVGRIDVRLLLVANERADEYVRRTLGRDIPEWASRVQAREVVADFYSMADIFLSASRLEGFPWSVTEAIAAGTPVISSDIGALAWAKRIPSVTFFPLDRPELLADAVRTIICWTKEERKARIAEGQRIIHRDYSVEAWSRRMAEVYRAL